MQDGNGKQTLGGPFSGGSKGGEKPFAVNGSRAGLATRALLDLVDQAILLLDARDLRVLEAAPGVERLLGYSQAEVRATSLFSLLADGAKGPAGRSLRKMLATRQEAVTLQAVFRCNGGGQLLVGLALRRLMGPVPLLGAVLRHPVMNGPHGGAVTPFGHNDPLTGLPNRRAWDERMASALTRAAKDAALNVAVLFVDLDHFKQVNDRFGHSVGDHVLRVVAQRLVASVRPEDVVARFGGDEFVVLLQEAPSRRQVTGIARRICRKLREPIECGQHWLSVSASVGVRIAPAQGESPADFLDAADRAMYRAKQSGHRTNQPGHWVLNIQTPA